MAPSKAKPSSKHLQQLFDKLPLVQQNQLVEYAEFLAGRYRGAVEPAQPLDFPRPKDETVIAAMKRLRQAYPMLDPENLLNETSALMSEHMLQGKAAPEVIDDLEKLFDNHYQKLLASTDHS